MKAQWILIGIMALTAAASAQQEKGGSSLDRGIATWLENNQADALRHFRLAVVEEPRNADAHAWLAEALRRSGSMDSALAVARRTIELSPCHPQAHTTLADLYNPQYSGWEHANSDSTWAHDLKAVECDPNEGIAWFSIWIEAMRRGDREMESKALRSLASNEFITPGAFAYARWLLGSLPKNAILLTNGDMDTYPLVTLQQSKGFRKDVAVINASLLNLNWYASLMTTRHGITGGFTVGDIGAIQPEPGDPDEVNLVSRSVIGQWIAAREKGTLKRPLAIAVGVNWPTIVSSIDSFTLAGPYWIYNTGRKQRLYDGTTLWGSLRSLKPSDFTGPFVSLRDRSPIRRAYAPTAADGAVIGDLRRALDAMRDMEDKQAVADARRLEEWIWEFDMEAGGVNIKSSERESE